MVSPALAPPSPGGSSLKASDAVFALIVAVSVLGLFAAQPLVGLFGKEFHLGTLSGLTAMLPLCGYAVGMIFLVPLVDIRPGRSVVLITLAVLACSSGAAAIAGTATSLLAALFGVGLGSSAIQMLLPIAAARSSESSRGRTIGNVMSGLMIGIMLSRPAASIVAGLFGWRWFYGALMVAITVLAAGAVPVLRGLPARGNASYRQTIAALPSIIAGAPELRRHALHQALLMAVFNGYWTVIGLLLAGPLFRLNSVEIGMVALAGAGGAVSAPITGRIADSGGTSAMKIIAPSVVSGAILMSALAVWWATENPKLGHRVALAILCLSAILLDAGVIIDQTVGRRCVNMLDPAKRGRLNGLYTGLFFSGGAAGSIVAGPVWFSYGWAGISFACGLTALLVLVLVVFGQRSSRKE